MPKQRRQQIQRQMKRERREQKSRSEFINLPTAKKARRTARAQANVEYRPVLRGLRSEIAGSKKREKDLGDWYSGLTAQNQAAQQSAAATSQAQESALTQRLANASASDSAALKDLASKNEATAKLLGGPANSRGLAEATAGNTALAQQRVALTSPLTAERASHQNYLAQRGISATERGIEARGAETARRRKIKEDLRAGKKERGQTVVANLERLREGARDYAIQKQAFGQKGRELGMEARQAAADRRLKAREGAADRRIDQARLGQAQAGINLDRAEHRRRERERREKARGGGLTPIQQRDEREDRRSAIATGRRAIKANGVPKTAREWAGLEAIIAEEEGVSPIQAAEAARRLRQKYGQRRKQGREFKPFTIPGEQITG